MYNKFEELMDAVNVDKMKDKALDLVQASKINALIHKEEEEAKKKNTCLGILAGIGIVAVIAAIAYAVYRYFTPDYLEDFEDDFEDEFDDLEDEDDDFFVDEGEH